MLGGSLTRYHTPTLKGKGLSRDLLTWASPSLTQAVGHGIEAWGRGATPREALANSGHSLKRNLKGAVKRKVQEFKNESYKAKRARVKDILGI